jgi:hypothetical protein
MEDRKIDTETAHLIVQMYQKISKLKVLLNCEPYPQLRAYLSSGVVLNEMMNNIFNESSQNQLEMKLNAFSLHLKNLLSQSDSFQNTQEHHDIKEIFTQLITSISLLQSRIHAEK